MGKMEFYFRFTAGLLLLVQSFHVASLQFSTDSPAIDKSWLRELTKFKTESQNAAVPGDEVEYDQTADETDVESNNDPNDPVASGSIAVYSGEKENGSEDQGSDDLTVTTIVPPVAPNVTAMRPESPDNNTSPSVDNTNSSQINTSDHEEASLNSTTAHPNPTATPSLQNSTSVSSDSSNDTDLQTTTSAPEGNATEESTSKPQEGTDLTNATEHSNVTTATSTASPEINETTTTSATTTVLAPATTKNVTVTLTTIDLETPERSNRTDTGSEEGSSGEREGLESDPHRSSKKGAWGAVLGLTVAVALVGVVAYFILKKKDKKVFSHRKLVEEYPADPVLRLDNGEPLDFSFGGSAYYNPGLQGDNIQMSNFPGQH